MKIEITKEENVYSFMSQEEFNRSIYAAPRVEYLRKIEYTVDDISFNSEILLDSSYPSVCMKSLRQYKNENNFERTTKEVIDGAILEAIEYSSGQYMDKSKKELYKALQSQKKHNKHQEAIDKSIELIKRKNKAVMLYDVKDLPVSEIDEFGTYLYFYIGSISFRHDHEYTNVKTIATEGLAYDMLFMLRGEYYNLEDIDGNLEYMRYLCEDLGYCSVKAIGIAKGTRNTIKIMDKLSESEKLENFIIDNVSESEIDEALECHDVKSIKELYDEHKKAKNEDS